jgi:hypothetical protein
METEMGKLDNNHHNVLLYLEELEEQLKYLKPLESVRITSTHSSFQTATVRNRPLERPEPQGARRRCLPAQKAGARSNVRRGLVRAGRKALIEDTRWRLRAAVVMSVDAARLTASSMHARRAAGLAAESGSTRQPPQVRVT